MIIKSMSRKQATFGQLLDYMDDGREDTRFTLKHNLYTHSKQKIKQEFETNASFFKKRKNGVYMYHEVISITKSKQLNDEQQKEKLRHIVLDYIEKRAKYNLVYAVLHDDKTDNFHYHLLISSNKLEDTKKHRLSKSEFDKIKKDLEIMVLNKHPELQQSVVINKPAKEKLSQKGEELKRRTGKTTQRDSVKNRLKTVFEHSKDKHAFFNNLENENLEVYIRGKTIGIVDKKNHRKHRLKTLGMLDDFNKISSIIEKSETLNKETENRKENIQEHRKPYREKISIKNNPFSTQKDKEKKQGTETKEDIKKQGTQKEAENKSKQNSDLTEKQQEQLRRKEQIKKSRESDKQDDFNKTKNR